MWPMKKILYIGFVYSFLFLSIANAGTSSGCIPGTYLVQESSGTQSLWTFSSEGTIQSASSSQEAFHFSDAQGAWKQIRSRQARVTMLDFTYSSVSSDGGVPPASVARIDALFTFSKNCKTLEGSFELRFFDPETEDPLNPETDTGDPVPDTFTGRRVIAK